MQGEGDPCEAIRRLRTGPGERPGRRLGPLKYPAAHCPGLLRAVAAARPHHLSGAGVQGSIPGPRGRDGSSQATRGLDPARVTSAVSDARFWTQNPVTQTFLRGKDPLVKARTFPSPSGPPGPSAAHVVPPHDMPGRRVPRPFCLGPGGQKYNRKRVVPGGLGIYTASGGFDVRRTWKRSVESSFHPPGKPGGERRPAAVLFRPNHSARPEQSGKATRNLQSRE
jgi:hypothetical protein